MWSYPTQIIFIFQAEFLHMNNARHIHEVEGLQGRVIVDGGRPVSTATVFAIAV